MLFAKKCFPGSGNKRLYPECVLNKSRSNPTSSACFFSYTTELLLRNSKFLACNLWLCHKSFGPVFGPCIDEHVSSLGRFQNAFLLNADCQQVAQRLCFLHILFGFIYEKLQYWTQFTSLLFGPMVLQPGQRVLGTVPQSVCMIEFAFCRFGRMAVRKKATISDVRFGMAHTAALMLEKESHCSHQQQQSHNSPESVVYTCVSREHRSDFNKPQQCFPFLCGLLHGLHCLCLFLLCMFTFHYLTFSQELVTLFLEIQETKSQLPVAQDFEWHKFESPCNCGFSENKWNHRTTKKQLT